MLIRLYYAVGFRAIWIAFSLGGVIIKLKNDVILFQWKCIRQIDLDIDNGCF